MKPHLAGTVPVDDPVPVEVLVDYPDLREERAKALHKEYRTAGQRRRNALRDSREEAAGRLERTEARIAEMREEAKVLGIELEPRRRQARSSYKEHGGGIGD